MVILWLIHAKTPVRVAIVEAQNQSGFPVLGDHGESADRYKRQFVPASDLSAFVGKVLAYRGCDG